MLQTRLQIRTTYGRHMGKKVNTCFLINFQHESTMRQYTTKMSYKEKKKNH